jgi:hypothetical protein
MSPLTPLRGAGMCLLAIVTMTGCASIRILTDAFDPSHGQVGVCTWESCKSGAASFTIDDGATICRTEMEAAGFRGTYFYNGASTEPWFAAYSASGHEIGSHLTDHMKNCTRRPKGFPDLTPKTLRKIPYAPQEVAAFRASQIEPNITAIEAGTGKPVVSMAWPCGSTDAGRMAAAAHVFLGSRGYYDPWDSNLQWVQDVNDATPIEFQNLNAADHYDQTFIDRAISEGKWAIITTHEVCTGVSYIGSRLDRLWVAPVGDVLKYILVRNAAQFSNYVRSRDTVTFDVMHEIAPVRRQKVDGTMMVPIEFDNPVTIKARLREADEVRSVEIDGVAVPYVVTSTQEGRRDVLFDTALHRRQHVTVAVLQR